MSSLRFLAQLLHPSAQKTTESDAATKAPRTFTCSICLETKRDTCRNQKTIETDVVCADCVQEGILPQFEAALNHESQYPPHWGKAYLQAADLSRELGKDFVQRYERREQEYLTPVPRRVFCQNMIFADAQPAKGARAPKSKKLALTPKQVETAKQQGKQVVDCGVMLIARPDIPLIRSVLRPGVVVGTPCWSCNGTACSNCGEATHPRGPAHRCTFQSRNKRETIVELEDEGLVRGSDFQICPNENCERVVTLRDGCNRVYCPSASCAGVKLCMVCGQVAQKEHFEPGMPCPVWPQQR